MSPVTQASGAGNQVPSPSLCGQGLAHADTHSASSQALLSSPRTHSSLQFKVNEHSLVGHGPSLFWWFLSCSQVPRASVWQVAPVGFGEFNQILGWEWGSGNSRIQDRNP